jgi:hypothetical protein
VRIQTFGAMAVVSLFFVTPVLAQQATAAAGGTDHVTAIKQSLQASMAALRQYQWVETTTVSIKGDEKSRTQNSCYYGADGEVQKTPIGEPAAEPKKKRGVRGKIVEKKKGEISESMQEAMALVKQYVPPDPAKIQAAKAAGNLSVVPPDPQGNVKVTIADYLKAGDSLAFDLNAATDTLSGVAITTFTNKAKNTVRLNVAFSSFADGTIYTSSIYLEVAAEDLAVEIKNSGYKKLGG